MKHHLKNVWLIFLKNWLEYHINGGISYKYKEQDIDIVCHQEKTKMLKLFFCYCFSIEMFI